MGYQNQWAHGNKQIDWDNVNEGAPKPPEPGLYDLKMLEVEVTETSGKGKDGKPKDKAPMIKVRMEIVKADDSANEEFIGRTVFDNWVFTQEGAFKVKNAARVMGKDLPTSLDIDDLDSFAKSCEGEVVTAMLGQRTYEGQKNANVRYYGSDEPGESNGNGNGNSREEVHPPAKGKGGKPSGKARR